MNNKNVTKSIEKLELLKQQNFVKDNNSYMNNIEVIIERLCDKNFKLAVVGEFSSGKSTFLNALISKDLLSHGMLETTATITEIENTVSKQEVFDVYYNDGNVKKDLPYNKLPEFTTVQSDGVKVAEEIERVIVKNNVMDSKSPISFVDTPGLNGVADHHREKTINEIQTAHACIYMLSIRGIGQSDKDFINYLCQYQKNFIFVQNFIDELNDIENETCESKVKEQKGILKKIFEEENNSDINFDVIGISAKQALVSRDNGIKTYNKEEVDDAKRKKLYEDSNFKVLLDGFYSLIESNIKNNTKEKDSLSVAIQSVEFILDNLQSNNKLLEEQWSLSPEARKKANYGSILENIDADTEKNIDKLSNFIDSEIISSNRILKKVSDEEVDKSVLHLENRIKSLTSINQYESFANNIDNTLRQKFYDINAQCENIANERLKNIMSDASLRISEYSGQSLTSSELPKFVKKSINQDSTAVDISIQNEINRLKKGLESAKKITSSSNSQISRLNQEKNNQNSLMQQQKQNIRQKENEKQQQINRLGSRPQAEEKSHIVERKESRAQNKKGLGKLFGKAVDFLAGEKIVRETKYYTDDSNVREWEKRRSNINSEYENELQRLQNQEKAYKRKKDEIEYEIQNIKDDASDAESKLRRYESQIKAKEKEIQAQKEYAKAEYLKKAKNQLINQISDYSDKMKELSYNDTKHYLSENKPIIKSEVIGLFKSSMKERKKMLERLISDENGEDNLKASKIEVETIAKIKKDLEDILCQM